MSLLLPSWAVKSIIPVVKPAWYSILLAARKIDTPITSAALAKGAGIERSSASAWLAKFVKWGYARRIGHQNRTDHWVRLYSLTGYGRNRSVPVERHEISGTPGRAR